MELLMQWDEHGKLWVSIHDDSGKTILRSQAIGRIEVFDGRPDNWLEHYGQMLATYEPASVGFTATRPQKKPLPRSIPT